MDIIAYKQKHITTFSKYQKNITNFTNLISNHTTSIDIKSLKIKLILPNSIKTYKYNDNFYSRKNKSIIYPNSISYINLKYTYGISKKEFITSDIVNCIFLNKISLSVDGTNNIQKQKNNLFNVFLIENITNILVNYNKFTTKNLYFLKNIKNIKLIEINISNTESFLFKNIKYLYVSQINHSKLYVSNTNILTMRNYIATPDVKSFICIKKIKILYVEMSQTEKRFSWYGHCKLNTNANYLKNIHTVILHNCLGHIDNICILKNTRILVMHDSIKYITYDNAIEKILKYETMYKFIDMLLINEHQYHKKQNTNDVYKMYDEYIYSFFNFD